jgi:hypothetical protein
MDERGLCANPACGCDTTGITCSAWCAALDVPAGAACSCPHEACACDPLALDPPMTRPVAGWRAGGETRAVA